MISNTNNYLITNSIRFLYKIGGTMVGCNFGRKMDDKMNHKYQHFQNKLLDSAKVEVVRKKREKEEKSFSQSNSIRSKVNDT